MSPRAAATPAFIASLMPLRRFSISVISWGIAFFEYCFQVPANRIGSGTFSAAQLKVIQEVISLLVFAGFSVWWLGEALRWNHLGAFFCLVGAVWFMFAA